MNSNISLVVFSSQKEQNPALSNMLATCGWNVISYNEPFEIQSPEFHAQIMGLSTPLLFVLTDISVSSLGIMSYLQTQYAFAGTVLVYGTGNEAELVPCFQLGVDVWAPSTASSELLMSMLLKLASRQRELSAVSQPVTTHATPWHLDAQGWSLVGPEGISIPLTTGERAFLEVLLSAPGKQASREVLIEAIHGQISGSCSDKDRGRLGVMISRLRRKTEAYGYVLPVKSLHNWGYMFTA